MQKISSGYLRVREKWIEHGQGKVGTRTRRGWTLIPGPAWFEANVEGFEGPISYSKFKGGQSNPTYRIDTPDRSYVLRRQPFGKLLPSAHAVDREYRA